MERGRYNRHSPKFKRWEYQVLSERQTCSKSDECPKRKTISPNHCMLEWAVSVRIGPSFLQCMKEREKCNVYCLLSHCSHCLQSSIYFFLFSVFYILVYFRSLQLFVFVVFVCSPDFYKLFSFLTSFFFHHFC